MGSTTRWSRTAGLIAGLALFVALVAVPAIGSALPFATIKGTVTNSSGGALAGVHVVVQSFNSWVEPLETDTNQAGAYSVDVAEAGGYNITLFGGVYVVAPRLIGDLPAGVVTQNFTMLRSGGFSGSVVDALGAPISGVVVQSVDGNAVPDGEVLTGADGTYQISGLIPGSHGVFFYDGNGSRIAPQWYDGAGMNFEAATFFTVAEGAITPGINVRGTTAQTTFTITPTAGLHGSISPSGVQTVASGDGKTFTIVAALGYRIDSVLVDGVASADAADGSYTFTNVTANHTIAAAFVVIPPTMFTITPTAGLHGSIAPATAQSVASGASRTFAITADTGYHIDTVLVDGVASVDAADGSYTFTNVTANHTIAATFVLTPPTMFTITPTAGLHGSISPAVAQTIASGGNQTFTITAAAGYQIDTVLVDGVASADAADGSYTFTNVSASHTIAATFAVIPPATFTITPTAGPNGSISPLTVQTVVSGGSRIFTITPDTGYRIDAVLVDGVASVDASDGSFAFTNVTADHTIAATFALDATTPPTPVATTLKLKVTATSLRVGKYVTISSILSGGVPEGSHVRYQLRLPGKNAYTTISSTRPVSATGSSSARYKLTKKGTYYFRARFLGIDGFSPSTSNVVKVVVK